MRGLLAKYKFNGEMNSCVVVVPFTKSADLRDEKYSRCWKNNTHTTQFSCLMKDLLGKMTGQSLPKVVHWPVWMHNDLAWLSVAAFVFDDLDGQALLMKATI